METITISVDSEIKTAFEQASPETLQKLITLLNLLFKDKQKEQALTENSDETEEDWGLAEQNAYARMNENSHQNISGEVFLNWLSELEKGENQDFVPTAKQIRQVAEKSSSFDFLHAEPDLYTLADGEPI
ncbi:MAG: hypothetical protein ACKO7P_10675 [Bacteroidota bacterium]